MTVIRHEDASNTPCPLSRTFSDPKPNCRGDACMLWRWLPLLADEPAFKAAIASVAEEQGVSHQKAVRMVMDDRAAHGLPDKPYRGFCGVAGKPEFILP